jgi:hypothetical protein
MEMKPLLALRLTKAAQTRPMTTLLRVAAAHRIEV